MNSLAPVCLFTYNRIDETIETVKALKNNYLARDTELFIFSDGWKNGFDGEKVKSVRKYIKSVEGFRSVTIFESKMNKGLANSIIEGVSKIVKKHEKVIVLEDDLISSRNFLSFMNQSLDYYSEQREIFNVSGFTMNLPTLENIKHDFYLGLRASSWGWGTWNDRWSEIDWQVNDYEDFKWNLKKQIQFMKGGSDLPYMLWKQMNGKIDSWAIRWCYHQFKYNSLTLFPTKSKIRNIGFNNNATNTRSTNRFYTTIDSTNRQIFNFADSMDLDINLVKEFSDINSFKARLLDKFKITKP